MQIPKLYCRRPAMELLRRVTLPGPRYASFNPNRAAELVPRTLYLVSAGALTSGLEADGRQWD